MTLQELLRLTSNIGPAPVAGNSANVVRPGGPVAGSISQTRDYRSPTYGQTVPYPQVKVASTYRPTGAGILAGVLAGAQTGASGGLNSSNQNTSGGGGGQVLGASTENTGPSEEELAALRRRAEIEDAKAKAASLVNEGQSTFDTLLKAANAFRDRSNSLYKNADQEILNTFSENAGQNARTAQELEGDVRARGRAAGLGDSSKFNLQNKVIGNLAATQGSLMANKGENERANQAQLQERMDTAQNQENQANDYLTAVKSEAGNIERAGMDNATLNFASLLDNIRQRANAIKALSPLSGSSLSQFAPDTSGVVNTLNNLFSGGNSFKPAGETDSVVSLSDPSTMLEKLKRMRGTYAS